jgi:hypothetical protein
VLIKRDEENQGFSCGIYRRVAIVAEFRSSVLVGFRALFRGYARWVGGTRRRDGAEGVDRVEKEENGTELVLRKKPALGCSFDS